MSDDGKATPATPDKKEEEEEAPPAKKVKSGTMEQAPASEWPEAWLMPEGECADQKKPNKCEPNVPVTVDELKDLGIW